MAKDCLGQEWEAQFNFLRGRPNRTIPMWKSKGILFIYSEAGGVIRGNDLLSYGQQHMDYCVVTADTWLKWVVEKYCCQEDGMGPLIYWQEKSFRNQRKLNNKFIHSSNIICIWSTEK